MKVKVSTVLAKEIAKYIATVSTKEYCVKVEKHGDSWYRMNMPLDSMYYPENDQDFDCETGKFRVIAVYRPNEYYACPVYLSSYMILKAFRSLKERTLESLLNRIWEDFIEC